MLNRILVVPKIPMNKNIISTSDAFKLMSFLVDGNSILDADPKLIESVFSEKTNPEAYRNGVFYLHNYSFDFKEFLTEYLVQTKDKGWNKVLACSAQWVIRNSSDANLITEVKVLTH